MKDNSELRITKSGVVVGQTQVDIGMGTSNSPVLGDGATIRAVEPKRHRRSAQRGRAGVDGGEAHVTSVETITQDLQGGLKAGGKALEQVAVATQDLPSVVASVQRTIASGGANGDGTPAMTGSIKRTLSVVDRVTADVQQATGRLPAILDSAESRTLTSVKRRVRIRGRGQPGIDAGDSDGRRHIDRCPRFWCAARSRRFPSIGLRRTPGRHRRNRLCDPSRARRV